MGRPCSGCSHRPGTNCRSVREATDRLSSSSSRLQSPTIFSDEGSVTLIDAFSAAPASQSSAGVLAPSSPLFLLSRFQYSSKTTTLHKEIPQKLFRQSKMFSKQLTIPDLHRLLSSTPRSLQRENALSTADVLDRARAHHRRRFHSHYRRAHHTPHHTAPRHSHCASLQLSRAVLRAIRESLMSTSAFGVANDVFQLTEALKHQKMVELLTNGCQQRVLVGLESEDFE